MAVCCNVLDWMLLWDTHDKQFVQKLKWNFDQSTLISILYKYYSFIQRIDPHIKQSIRVCQKKNFFFHLSTLLGKCFDNVRYFPRSIIHIIDIISNLSLFLLKEG